MPRSVTRDVGGVKRKAGPLVGTIRCRHPNGSASHELSIYRLTTSLRSLLADVMGERRYVFCFRLRDLCAGADVVLQRLRRHTEMKALAKSFRSALSRRCHEEFSRLTRRLGRGNTMYRVIAQCEARVERNRYVVSRRCPDHWMPRY